MVYHAKIRSFAVVDYLLVGLNIIYKVSFVENSQPGSLICGYLISANPIIIHYCPTTIIPMEVSGIAIYIYTYGQDVCAARESAF